MALVGGQAGRQAERERERERESSHYPPDGDTGGYNYPQVREIERMFVHDDHFEYNNIALID